MTFILLPCVTGGSRPLSDGESVRFRLSISNQAGDLPNYSYPKPTVEPSWDKVNPCKLFLKSAISGFFV